MNLTDLHALATQEDELIDSPVIMSWSVFCHW